MSAKPRAYLLSLLTFQFLAKKHDEFLRLHQHPWLVWEPGAWSPSRNAARPDSTKLPTAPVQTPTAGDALCFELSAPQERVTLGRAPENDVVINDATVSRDHLVLRRAGAAWTIELLPEAKVCKLDGRELQPASPAPLQSASHLELGQVQLTFLEPEGMAARVAEAGRRLAT